MNNDPIYTASSDLFDELRKIIPSIPQFCTKLVITLEASELATIECSYWLKEDPLRGIVNKKFKLAPDE